MKRGKLRIRFWGTRGSIPSPGRQTLLYGGNTSCLEITYQDHSLILDGGTGIRLLGQSLSKSRHPKRPLSILISHTHMDHIGGIPFFAPALNNGSLITIYGPPGLKRSLQSLFPFPRLKSKRKILEMNPRSFKIPPFRISCHWVNHPGGSLGYKIRTPRGQSIVYISDHEPSFSARHGHWAPSDEEIIRWIGTPDLLIMDAQYFEPEYTKRQGWGHSPLPYTIQLAIRTKTKRLCLFHHDPNHSDTILKQKLKLARLLIARSGAKLLCSLAQEGATIAL